MENSSITPRSVESLLSRIKSESEIITHTSSDTSTFDKIVTSQAKTQLIHVNTIFSFRKSTCPRHSKCHRRRLREARLSQSHLPLKKRKVSSSQSFVCNDAVVKTVCEASAVVSNCSVTSSSPSILTTLSSGQHKLTKNTLVIQNARNYQAESSKRDASLLPHLLNFQTSQPSGNKNKEIQQCVELWKKWSLSFDGKANQVIQRLPGFLPHSQIPLHNDIGIPAH